MMLPRQNILMSKSGSHQRFWQYGAAWIVAMFACAWPAVAACADLTVFAAASLRGALDSNVKAFGAQSGHRVRVSYAGSNALARQIENGAPADLFISADEEWMDYAVRKNLLASGARRVLASNSLVLIAPAALNSAASNVSSNAASSANSISAGSTTKSANPVPLKIAPNFALAQALQGGRLALANPDAVPAGKYARAALITLGVWPAIEHSLTRSENVRAALLLVARGEAPLGIVYATDAKAEPKVWVVDTFAANLHPPILYSAAVTARGKPEATALLAYLAGPEARVVWRAHGFAAAP